MWFLNEAVTETFAKGMQYGMYLLVLVAAEVLFAKDRVSVASRLQAGVFWTISIPVTALIFVSFTALWGRLEVRPLLSLALGDVLGRSVPAAMLGAILAAIVADFWFYWFHRTQHAIFWRFHAVHHSITELSAVSSYHHVSEEVFRVLLVVVPSSLLLDVRTSGAPLALSLLIAGHGFYVHTNTRMHMGWARWLLVDNAYHRIHHSTDPAHFGKNFGAFTTLWDRLFGTAYFPRRDEWPPTGLADQPEPDGVGVWLTAPFRHRTP